MKNKFQSTLILILFFGVAVIGVYFLFFKPDLAGNTEVENIFGWKFPVAKFPLVGADSDQFAYSTIRNTEIVPEGLPVRLQIPIIGVDSAIEDALITPDGRMDVPAGSVNVAWFALGPHPGEVGSAVIGGHFGIRNGVPFVFYKLDKLVVGDKAYIVNDKGETLAFQVRSIKLFDRNADATTVFTSNDGLAHLNLITCEGVWNAVNGNYPERRVVFTDLIPGEGAIVVKALASSAFRYTLRIGARGQSVVALQTFLNQKGFFGTSPGIIDGVFGIRTRDAVAKYQTSAGLFADGVFGPLTKAHFISEQSKAAVGPTLPSTAIIIPQPFSSSQTNGLVTSILLIVIIFTISKIILSF